MQNIRSLLGIRINIIQNSIDTSMYFLKGIFANEKFLFILYAQTTDNIKTIISNLPREISTSLAPCVTNVNMSHKRQSCDTFASRQ